MHNSKSKTEHPVFSVLVPSYNQAVFLPTALDSLLAQTRPDWEAIVVNDGSIDDAEAVMRAYVKKDARIRGYTKANGGCASALNEGLKHALGEWICWLSSDDMFEPDKLEVHHQAIQEHPRIRFFHSRNKALHDKTGSISEPGTLLPYETLPSPFQVLSLLKHNAIAGNSICVHRSAFESVGEFDETLWYGQDIDMWLRLSARFPWHFINRCTCITRVHSGQDTNRFPEAGLMDFAFACVKFLNAHSFTDVFPLLDLKRPDPAMSAVRSTLLVCLDTKAMMYQGSYIPALLDRLHEWISKACPRAWAAEIRRQMSRLSPVAQQSGLPPGVQTAWEGLKQAGEDDFTYRPYDFLAEMKAYAQTQPPHVHELLNRYCSMMVPRVARSKPLPPNQPEKGSVEYQTTGLDELMWDMTDICFFSRRTMPAWQEMKLASSLLNAYVQEVWQRLNKAGPRQGPLRIAVFGAGDHTAWLEQAVRDVPAGPEVVAVLDDRKNLSVKFWKLKPVHPEGWDARQVDAILLSSDTVAEAMENRCRQLYGMSVRLIRLYEHLPPGPYPKWGMSS